MEADNELINNSNDITTADGSKIDITYNDTRESAKATHDNEADDDDANDTAEVSVDASLNSAPPAPSVARLVYSAYSEMRPAPGTRYAPLGLFGYIGLLLLTSIPAVGLISSMVIALCAKRAAVQRFALAVVILRTLFWVIAAAAVAVAVYAFDVDVFGLIGKYFTLIRDAA